MQIFLLSTVLCACANALDVPALLASLTIADLSDPRFADWQAPKAGDVRSPCPGLNSLANHGFLNRNGKNNSIVDFVVGGYSGLAMGPDFMSVIGAVGLLSSPNPALGTFDLDDLDLHDFPIEHDASLSRQDHYFGEWYNYNDTVFQEVLAYFKGETATTIPTASLARYHRVQMSLNTNPELLYGPEQFLFSSAESGLYTQTMGSPLTNSAPVDYVEYFFKNERLPVALGWKPSLVPITFASLGSYAVELYAANPDKVMEASAFTEDSFANLLVELAGGMAALSNLTQGITDFVNIPGQ